MYCIILQDLSKVKEVGAVMNYRLSGFRRPQLLKQYKSFKKTSLCRLKIISE